LANIPNVWDRPSPVEDNDEGSQRDEEEDEGEEEDVRRQAAGAETTEEEGDTEDEEDTVLHNYTDVRTVTNIIANGTLTVQQFKDASTQMNFA
jgi:hypothetical protein